MNAEWLRFALVSARTEFELNIFILFVPRAAGKYSFELMRFFEFMVLYRCFANLKDSQVSVSQLFNLRFGRTVRFRFDLKQPPESRCRTKSWS